MTIRLDVTQEDIDLARIALLGDNRSLSYNCPIAQAIKRRFGKPDILVSPLTVYIWDENGDLYKKFRLSPNASRFILAFDAKKAVAPSTFVLS